MSEHYVISITREFGSLGRPIAKHMAEMLRIEYYDREIVEMTARKMNKAVSVISNIEESESNPFFDMKFPLGNGEINMQRAVFEAQKEIIQNIATRESCIIIGRCSDYILKDYANHLSIFVYAPYEERYYNCVDVLNIPPQKAKKMITDVDKARAKYYKTYAKSAPGDIRTKDILINSSVLGADGTAELLVEMVRKKFKNII